MTARTAAGRVGDAGFVVAEWMVGVTLLILPTMLLVGVLPGWAARHAAAEVAAREATRAAATARTPAGAVAAAEVAAAQVLQQRGVVTIGAGPAAGAAEVTVGLPSSPAGRDLPRDGVVRVVVAVTGPSLHVPIWGDLSPPTVTGTHERRLDDWRSR